MAVGHFFRGDYAAVQDFAVFVFELEGGVADVVVVFEDVVDLLHDAGGCGGRDVGDGDVAGEGAGVGAKGPDMEVVDVEDAGNALHGGADFVEADAGGCAFEKDVESFADDAGRGPEDEGGNDEREDGVDPVAA